MVIALYRHALHSQSLNDYSELGIDAMCLLRDYGDLRESDYSSTAQMHEAITRTVQTIFTGSWHAAIASPDSAFMTAKLAYSSRNTFMVQSNWFQSHWEAIITYQTP